MPKAKAARARGRARRVRPKRKKAQPKVNQVSPVGRILTDRIGPNPALVVIEDKTVRMMLADPRFLEAVPCLREGKKRLSNVAKTCGRCSARRVMMHKQAMNGIRACMAGLTGRQRVQVKKLLRAKQVRVILRGKHITY